MQKYLWGLAALALLTGCGSSTAPPSPRALAYQPGLIAEGSGLFSSTCAVCHGENGQGINGPALWGPNSAVRSFSSFAPLEEFIQDNMPASNPGSLTAHQAQQVSSFIWSKNHHAHGLPGS